MSARDLTLAGAALGVLSLGLPWRGQPGTGSVARFFIVAALALALAGGLHLGRRVALRWAAYVAAAGVLLHLSHGSTGGWLVLLAASGCFWLASRREGLSPSAC